MASKNLIRCEQTKLVYFLICRRLLIKKSIDILKEDSFSFLIPVIFLMRMIGG